MASLAKGHCTVQGYYCTLPGLSQGLLSSAAVQTCVVSTALLARQRDLLLAATLNAAWWSIPGCDTLRRFISSRINSW